MLSFSIVLGVDTPARAAGETWNTEAIWMWWPSDTEDNSCVQ
jgi:hypothetical protein